jgi:hypothetical protein
MQRPSLGTFRPVVSAPERAVPKDAGAGARYPEAQLAHLDGEK